MLLKPHAKINLGLFIKGKREDGYHLLETLLFPMPNLYDELSIEESPEAGCTLALAGLPLDGVPDDNLCTRAYRLLQQIFPDLPGVRLHLQKGIPAGAGLGGGSSDAAATLKGINDLFSLGLSLKDLAPLAAGLGADVPFFLYDSPMIASGIGTELQPFSLDFPYRIELITPAIHSSTVGAYKALDYRQCDPTRELATILRGPISKWPTQLDNDLEIPVFLMYPRLKEIKESLYAQGALYAAMSGSGSAVFGIFDK